MDIFLKPHLQNNIEMLDSGTRFLVIFVTKIFDVLKFTQELYHYPFSAQNNRNKKPKRLENSQLLRKT